MHAHAHLLAAYGPSPRAPPEIACGSRSYRWLGRWEGVLQQQKLKTDHWEVHYVDAQRGKPYWCNWVTEEKTYTKPAESAAMA